MTTNCNNKLLLQKKKIGPCSVDSYLKYKLDTSHITEHDKIKHDIHKIYTCNLKTKFICEVSEIYLNILDYDNSDISDKDFITIEKYLMCISPLRRINKFLDKNVMGQTYNSDTQVYIVPIEYENNEDEYYELMNKKYNLLDKQFNYIRCDKYGIESSKDNDLSLDVSYDNNEIIKDIENKNKNRRFKIFKLSDKTLNNIYNKNKSNNNNTKTKYQPPIKKQTNKIFSLVLKNIPTNYNSRTMEKYLTNIFSKYKSLINIKVLKQFNNINSNKGIAFVDFNDENILDIIINEKNNIYIDNSVISIEIKKN